MRDSYPLSLKDQIKFLLENEDFFKTFGKFTEPYPDKLVKEISEKYKDKPFEIHKEYLKFKSARENINYFLNVKFIEDNKVRGTCTSSAMFACAVFRTMGYPAAILTGIDAKNIFNNINNFFLTDFINHSVCLVKIEGKWYVYDILFSNVSRFLSLNLISRGLIPALIFRDPADLGIYNKYQLFKLLMYNLEDILLLDLHEDLIFNKFYKLYKDIKASINQK